MLHISLMQSSLLLRLPPFVAAGRRNRALRSQKPWSTGLGRSGLVARARAVELGIRAEQPLRTLKSRVPRQIDVFREHRAVSVKAAVAECVSLQSQEKRTASHVRPARP